MACDGESPCRECKGSGSECSMDPAECGHAVLPSSDNLLERAFMARIRADEYREALAALQRGVRVAPRGHRAQAPDRALRGGAPAVHRAGEAAGISKQGSFLLKIRTRKQRTVIPKLFFAKHGAEAFVECATIAIGKAETLLGKAALDDCCEVETRETGVSVEYVRPEGSE
jgi:hypothetical protein